ncbi:hypothetical protein CSKR_108010 [Clonorchis sinensis]|uniref:Uncharacterized protein n=1 Tax=Clonorchis sinensis TaxID=79923 RepID=A0A419Q6E7_CLOSI|nr:hypothetical protein CSKR_108010 [Clonorchis sinensis]
MSSQTQRDHQNVVPPESKGDCKLLSQAQFVFFIRNTRIGSTFYREVRVKCSGCDKGLRKSKTSVVCFARIKHALSSQFNASRFFTKEVSSRPNFANRWSSFSDCCREHNYLLVTVLGSETVKWLESKFTDRSVRRSNPSAALRLPLSRFGQHGSIPALVLPSSGMCLVAVYFKGSMRAEILRDFSRRGQDWV